MTVSLREEQAQWIEENIGEGGDYESKSDAIRTIMDRHEELQEEVDELRKENERLHRERRQLLEQREENTELVEYVEDEQRYRRASLMTRMKWWLKGMDD
jgi:Arc/MetJ-type ribon-helix-helix transcriptional regulator